MAEAGLSAAGVDGGDGAGIAGELACSVEAIDAADLAVGHDGEDVSDARQGLEQQNGGGGANALADVLFQFRDLFLGEHLGLRAPGRHLGS